MWKKEKKQETQEVSPEKEEGRDLYEWAQALVCSVLAVVLLFTFVIRLIGVDGHSMVPTLQDGDRLLVLNAMLDNDYEYGDIVVLRKDTFLEEPIVKRVIATEGQTVDIDFVSCFFSSMWTGSCWRRTISTSPPMWRRGRNFP